MGEFSSTSGTLYFDDYESRRLTRIGLLADPGVDEPEPTPVAGWTNKSYSYDDDAHKHAVTAVVVTDTLNNQTTNTYKYDENGNMTCRRENGVTYLQAYNAENRISGVVVYAGDCDTLGEAISQSWIFTYDGDGNKVKQAYTNGTSTLTTYYYAGGAYEVQTDGTTTTVRQYYAIAGVSVGMTIDGEMSYFLTDHLGSIVVVTNDAGTLTSETRYLPFGEVRSDVGTISETNYGFTGQEDLPALNLQNFKARFYDSELGRFISPDSIVPEPGGSQGYNRYSYVNNDPINYTDLSGHMRTDDRCGYEGKDCSKRIPPKTDTPIPPVDNPISTSHGDPPPSAITPNNGVVQTEDKPFFGDSRGYLNEYGFTQSWSTRYNQNDYETFWFTGTDGSFGMEYMFGESSIFIGSNELNISLSPTFNLMTENTFQASTGYSIDLGANWADKKNLVLRFAIKSLKISMENGYTTNEYSTGVYMETNLTKGAQLGFAIATIMIGRTNINKIPTQQFRGNPSPISP